MNEHVENVTLTLSLDTARWLHRQMGRRPWNEDESREIWAELTNLLAEVPSA